MTKTGTKLYQKIVRSAKKHGLDSEPDHEVGDLHEVIEECLDIMSDDQAKQLTARLSARELEGF